MLYLLNTKNMGRKFVGFLYIFTLQKQFQEFFLVFFSADPPVLYLHDQRRILNDISYNIVGDL